MSTRCRLASIDPALVAVVVLGLLLRWVAAQMLPQDLLARTWEYEDVALNLLRGEGFIGYYGGSPSYGIVHPVYPAFCAAIYWLIGGMSSLVAIQVAQGLLVVPGAWFAHDLASRMAGPWAGRIAAAGVAMHPALMLFSLRRHALWLDAILFLAVLWAVYRVGTAAGRPRLVLLGVLFGVAILSRSTAAVFLLIACIWLALRWGRPWQRSILRTAAVIGVAGVTLLPWLARNALLDPPILGFVSTTPYGLWIGNNPAATGGAIAADGRTMDETAPDLMAQLRGLPEAEQQAIFLDVALAYMTENPGRTVAKYFQKLQTFLFWSDQTGRWYPPAFRIGYQGFYLLLLGFATIGAFHLSRRGRGDAVALLLGFVLSVGLTQSVFFVEGRHRWEVESAIVILAAAGVGLGRQRPREHL